MHIKYFFILDFQRCIGKIEHLKTNSSQNIYEHEFDELQFHNINYIIL